MIGDSDELATIKAAALEALGIPFKYVFKGDGVNLLSVEVVPDVESK